MSFCLDGLQGEPIGKMRIMIKLTGQESLIQLANTLNWDKLVQLVLPDLKQTTGCLKWWLGRKLHVRIHLGVYLLQQLFNQTDRGIEQQIQYNVLYQAFCGRASLKHWHCPDHTKIEQFRSRLSSATQAHLANHIAVEACKRGFADPAHVDIDSTVQEPDMQYPALSNLLLKACTVAKDIQSYLFKGFPELQRHLPRIELKKLNNYRLKPVG